MFLITVLQNAVTDCAQKQLGKPYVFGATGPNSFDCSGLAQYCYKQAGKSIPRGATAQCQSGTAVSESAGQPGDLVCFNQPNSPHVGIFFGVNQMIHAPKPGDVVKRSTYKWPGSLRFTGLRRI
uniref:NlpC/P60 family protein n=1 Tax=Trepomonas sp. PC1 TaxID=1076344 RepID=A0A146KHC3_9EUKA|eukprot:JAP96150.1 NlpC/P60 family protein [Trepomonas sp. PC1]